MSKLSSCLFAVLCLWRRLATGAFVLFSVSLPLQAAGEQCLPGGAAFAAPVDITHTTDVIETQPSIGVDGSGKVHIVFIGVYPKLGAPDDVASDIFYTNNIGGAFAAPVKIAVPTGTYSNNPDLAVEPNGTAHVAFRRSTSQTSVLGADDLYYATNRSGSFTSLVAVEGRSYPDLEAPQTPAIAVDAAGVVHLAFLGWRFESFDQAYYLNIRSGVVSPWVRASPGAADVLALSLALDRDGWPHLALFASLTFGDHSQLFYTEAVSDPLGTPQFAPLINASNVPRTVSDFYPALAVGADGVAHIAYRDPYQVAGGLYYVTNRGGSFGSRLSVPGTFAPALVLDAGGAAHVLSKACCFGAIYTNNVSGEFVGTTAATMNPAAFWGRHHLALGAGGGLHAVFNDYTATTDTHDVFYVAGQPACQPAPPPPAGGWITSSALPGFRFKVLIGGDRAGTLVTDCVPQTLCIAGAIPSRSELFVRIIGPRGNGKLWAQAVRFTVSQVELWIEQTSSREVNYYRLEGLPAATDTLSGINDSLAFDPGELTQESTRVNDNRADDSATDTGTAHVPRSGETDPSPPTGSWQQTSALPGYRFKVLIGGDRAGTQVSDCVPETLCIAGAIPSRSELFVRIIGPRGNGKLWAQAVRFTVSQVELWVEQTGSGKVNYYLLEALPASTDTLNGVNDSLAFDP